MTHLGIDPGASGGFGWVSPHGDAAIKMPETDKDIFDELCELRDNLPDVFCLLESVHSMPGQGVASTFSFGANFGALRMALTAAGIPYEMVTPNKWQREFGIPTLKQAGSNTAKKNAHKAVAQQLFPEIKITHAIADALLIAEYNKRTRKW